jgi:branched-subunit amino acid aminotransferase/4-amino-4-deoxychorismate lyase
MANSAAQFGLVFDRAAAMTVLGTVTGKGPFRVRLTLDESGQFACTFATLPENPQSWTYAISPQRVSRGDTLLRHKTDWRELYESEFARLHAETGCDEVLFLNERGDVAEGSRTNVFARIAGTLVTPPLSAGVLDGCLRGELLESGQCVEGMLTLGDLENAKEVFLGNSLRGLIPAHCFPPPQSGGGKN